MDRFTQSLKAHSPISGMSAVRIAREHGMPAVLSISLRSSCQHRLRPEGGTMNEVTLLLHAAGSGDPHAAEQLLPLIYDELRRLAAHRLAHEAPGQTMQ